MVCLRKRKWYVSLVVIIMFLLSNVAVADAAYTINAAVFTKTADNAKVGIAYADYANAMFSKSGAMFDYVGVISNNKAKLNLPVYAVKDSTGRIFTYADYANAMFKLPAGSKTVNNAFTALQDSKALSDSAIAAFKRPVVSGSTLTLDDYKNYVPQISNANVTINGASESLTIPAGFTGTLDWSAKSDNSLVTSGTMQTANKDATLKAISLVGENGVDGLVILTAAGKSVTQDISMSTATSLNLISYLGELDVAGNGVPLHYLRTVFGKSITIKGILTDKSKSNNLSYVTLTITLSN